MLEEPIFRVDLYQSRLPRLSMNHIADLDSLNPTCKKRDRMRGCCDHEGGLAARDIAAVKVRCRSLVRFEVC